MYCDRAALDAEFGAQKITGWSQGDETRVTSVCEAAAAVVDGYLSSGGYRTPVDPVVPLVRQFSVDIAAYRLLSSRGHFGADRDPGAEALINRYKSAIRYLEGVASGKLRIDGVNRPIPPTDGGTSASVQVRQTVPELDMEGYQ